MQYSKGPEVLFHLPVREGDVFHLVSDGNGDLDANYRTRLRRAWFGVGLVISGFTLQILGSFVSNLTN